jgi:hypothetical protein
MISNVGIDNVIVTNDHVNEVTQPSSFEDTVNSGIDYVNGTQVMSEKTLDLFAGPEGEQWKKVTKDEYDTFLEKEVATLVKRSSNTRVHKPKVIHSKKDEGGDKVRFKTRCVLAGWSMRKGIDYKETFSPTVRQDSLKVVLAIAAQKNYNILQFDYKTAYLNSKMKELVYMEIPPGFDVKKLTQISKKKNSVSNV